MSARMILISFNSKLSLNCLVPKKDKVFGTMAIETSPVLKSNEFVELGSKTYAYAVDDE